MEETEKRSVFLRGRVYNLVPGEYAFIHYNGTILRTSRVIAVHDHENDCVRFETLHSRYCVAAEPDTLKDSVRTDIRVQLFNK